MRILFAVVLAVVLAVTVTALAFVEPWFTSYTVIVTAHVAEPVDGFSRADVETILRLVDESIMVGDHREIEVISDSPPQFRFVLHSLSAKDLELLVSSAVTMSGRLPEKEFTVSFAGVDIYPYPSVPGLLAAAGLWVVLVVLAWLILRRRSAPGLPSSNTPAPTPPSAQG